MNDQTQAAVQVGRFDAYQVCPVVETTTPDGKINCEAFHTLTEAFDAKDIFDGRGRQRIFWTLYGLRKGIAEAIADRATEAQAFELLYSITGIPGTSGQTLYPVPCFPNRPSHIACRLF
ncbi:MAG: hypothetical protein WCE63_20460 [Acidobacteriaceae bacterium]